MKEKIKKKLHLYFIDAMGAMALGLFASLLIGTIFGTVSKYLSDQYVNVAWINEIGKFFGELKSFASGASGMAIGVAIAYAMKVSPLVMLSSAVVGSAGYSLGSSAIAYTAGPAGAFVAVVVACEIGMLVSKKTKVDILVTPSVTIIVGVLAAKLVCSPIAYLMYYLGDFINTATEYQPLIMGIVISVVVGMILTLPISSAAICAMIGISGIAGGAATVGCCAQMVGFAVISYRENKVSGLIAQGLGTSMLQMGNICKNPRIWIAPTLASAVCGPISTLIFKLKCTGVSAGMGTCGLVGPIGVIDATGTSAFMWLGLLLTCFVLPAILSFAFNEILRKIGWVKDGDMKLES